MKRRSLFGLVPAGFVGACSSSDGRWRTPVSVEPFRVGESLAYLNKGEGLVFVFTPSADGPVARNLSSSPATSFRRIFDAQTVWSDATASATAYLTLLVDDHTSEVPTDSRVVVISPDLDAVATKGLGPLARAKVIGGIAIVLPSAGAATNGFALVNAGVAMPLGARGENQFEQSSSIEVLYDHAGALDPDSFSVGTDVAKAKWIAVSTFSNGMAPGKVIIVHVDEKTETGARFSHLATYEVNLIDSGPAPVRPLNLLFDRLASRLFVWTVGAPEMFWLDLASAQPGIPPSLSRLELTSAPTFVAIASTGGSEVLIAVAPRVDGTTIVSVIDVLTLAVSTFTTQITADTLLVLTTPEGMPDQVVFFASAPLDAPLRAFGVVAADQLLAAAKQADELDPLLAVPVTPAYRELRRVGTDNTLWVNHADGTASLYNLSDARFASLSGWSDAASYVGAGTQADARVFAEEQGPTGGRLLRSFGKLDGKAESPLEITAHVLRLHQLASGAYVLVHPGTLGLLTYYDPTADTPSARSYTATGFLDAELAP